MTEEDHNKNRELANDGANASVSRDQSTAPDSKHTEFDGQTTQLSGISGVSLSYLPGDIVDNDYQLTKLLGRGGMGAVYACKHLALDRTYALKLLAGDQLSGEAWSRFQMEAQSLARLNHPGIVGIYNMGIDKNQCPYYVMDLLTGDTLDSLIARSGSLSVGQTLDIFIQVADALASAHLQGIIHRDIKPSNLMLPHDQEKAAITVKIVDFGIARLQKQGLVAQSQTATGLIFGTPYYMSPEQCQGFKVDERSDIYSLGCTVFEALTGAPPFVGDSAFHTFMMHQTEAPPALASRAPEANFPPTLQLAVSKMLNKNPRDRYQTMSQVKHDLERIKAGKEILAQGLSNTIPPKVSAAQQVPGPQANDKQFNRFKEIDRASHENDVNHGSEAEANGGWFSPLKICAALVLVIALFCVGVTYYLSPHSPEPKRSADFDALDSTDIGLFPKSYLKRMGATDEDFDGISEDDLVKLKELERSAERKLEQLQVEKSWTATKLMRNGAFFFPPQVIIGAISIDNQLPVLAEGIIPSSKYKDAYLYLMTSTKKSPELLDMLGSMDLTGISVVFRTPDAVATVVGKIANWERLKDLSFFNPLLKTITPGSEDWAEAKISDLDLPLLEKLPRLRSLGLCYPTSGEAISKMPLLKKLEGIRLERTKSIDVLLKELPQCDNLKEVFLMTQETTDEQLQTLALMKNLQKLTILRSRLTIGSLKYFQQMKSLRLLRLDRNDWSDEQKKEFQLGLPQCTVSYERVIDKTYWPMLPDDFIKRGLAKQARY